MIDDPISAPHYRELAHPQHGVEKPVDWVCDTCGITVTAAPGWRSDIENAPHGKLLWLMISGKRYLGRFEEAAAWRDGYWRVMAGIDAGHFGDAESVCLTSMGQYELPSHWQPLPAPPES